ncbi:quinon protein alcohol dehydrogenase-like superfamily, partial [Mycena galericulata]
MKLMNSADFFRAWKHSLSDDFQQGGEPAASYPQWVFELKRVEINGDGGVVALSPNNALVATVAGREIRVYDMASSRLHTLRGHTSHIGKLEFHPGGRKLASHSSLTPQMAVDVRKGHALVGQLPPFESRAFSRDGSSILYLPDIINVAVVDVNTITERFRLSGHTDAIMWAETSPDDKVIATSSWDKTVRIWSMESGETIHILEGATNQSWSGAFSPDGQLVAAGAGDEMVRIWRVDTGELLHTLGGFWGWVRSLSFSPDSLHLAAGADQGTLKIFNTKSGEHEQTWQIDVNSMDGSFLEIRGVQYTLRGDLFFTSTEGRIFGYRASQNSKWEFRV